MKKISIIVTLAFLAILAVVSALRPNLLSTLMLNGLSMPPLFSRISAADERWSCDISYANTNVVIISRSFYKTNMSEMMCLDIRSKTIVWKSMTNAYPKRAVFDNGLIYYMENSGLTNHYLVSRYIADGKIRWRTEIAVNPAYQDKTVNYYECSFPIVNGDEIVVFRSAVKGTGCWGIVKYSDYIRFNKTSGSLESMADGGYCGYTTNTILVNSRWHDGNVITLRNGVTNQLSKRYVDPQDLETCNLPNTRNEVPVQLNVDNKAIVLSTGESSVYIFDDVSSRFKTYVFSEQKKYQMRYILLKDCILRYAETARDQNNKDKLWIESYDYSNNLICRKELNNSNNGHFVWLTFCVLSHDDMVGFINDGKCYMLSTPSLKEIRNFPVFESQACYISYYLIMNSQFLIQSVSVMNQRSGLKNRIIIYNIADGSIYYEHVFR